MQYLSYEKYKALGGMLDNTAFIVEERLCEAEIDRFTFNRIKSEFDGTQAYKDDLELLVFYLISHPESQEGVISSESTDGVSVSYKAKSSGDIARQRNKAIINMLSQYADKNAVPLLYKGVR